MWMKENGGAEMLEDFVGWVEGLREYVPRFGDRS